MTSFTFIFAEVLPILRTGVFDKTWQCGRRNSEKHMPQ